MSISVQVKTSSGNVSELDCTSAVIRIGRDPVADIPFADKEDDLVSWQHAEIELKNGKVFLVDQNSTNGTYLNGKKVNRRVLLSLNDVVELGHGGPTITISAIVAPPPAPTPAAPSPAVTAASQDAVDKKILGIDVTPVTIGAAVAGLALLGIVSIALISAQATRASSVRLGKSWKPPVLRLPVNRRLTPDQVESKCRGSVVWIGWMDADVLVPFATGFLIENDVVVTSASNITNLRNQGQGDFRFVVSKDPQGNRFVNVKKIKAHRLFDRENPGKSESMTYNIGVLYLNGSLGDGLTLSSNTEVNDAKAVAIGFGMSKASDKDKKLRQIPTLASWRLTVSGEGSSSAFYVDGLNTSVDGMTGSPVLDEYADVIGVLVKYRQGAEIRATSVHQLNSLLRN